MRGVRGVSRGRFHVKSSDDSTLKSSSAATNVDPPDGRGGQDVQDALPNKGGDAAVSSAGVPGGASDKDGDAGALRAPARPRHRGDAGGGQPPPPTVSPVRPAGPQEGAQWAPSRDRAV